MGEKVPLADVTRETLPTIFPITGLGRKLK